LLAEAVESFRRQRLDGITAELIVVNDCPEQHLACSVPGVRIIQCMPPFARCVEKYNFAFAQARGEWLVFWDDDDIGLPGHVAWLMAQAATKPGCVMVRPLRLWHMCNRTIRGWGCAMLCNGMVRASTVAEIGGATPSEFIDQSLYFQLPKRGRCVEVAPIDEAIHYIYRWDGVGYHDSGEGGLTAEERAVRFRAAALAHPQFKPGSFDIGPEWKQNYIEEARRAVDTGLGKKRV
jgi:glycosyltransferase involved in cell wall biosynthesis